MSKTTDNYSTPDWLMEIFEGWFDPCPIISTGELRKFDGLGSWKNKKRNKPPFNLKWNN